MFSRLHQLSRHLSRPLSNNLHSSVIRPPSTSPRVLTSRITAMASERSTRQIHTAACLIIGDEVLGGKTVDTNSAWFAKFCFGLGITLRRVEVIADDEAEIVEAVRRMSSGYDFVVTSGGIGPTHDDITYASIAKAFGLPLVQHDTAFARMRRLGRQQEGFDWDVDSPQRRAKLRMVTLPHDAALSDERQVVFPADDLWVPINIVNGNVHILPGIPRLFEKMLTGLKPHLLPRLVDPEGKGVHRVLISTPMPESEVAEFLTQLSEKTEPKGVKVGSYPRWGKSRNTVTLVGKDLDFMESLVPEVETAVKGRRVQTEGEDDDSGSDNDK